jgi:hypothetical protein
MIKNHSTSSHARIATRTGRRSRPSLEQLDVRIALAGSTVSIHPLAQVAMVATGHSGPWGFGTSNHPVSINPSPGTTPPSSVGNGGWGGNSGYGPPLGGNGIGK